MFNLLPFRSGARRPAAVVLLSALFVVLIAPSANAQDCTCTNCPQFMPDGFTGSFFLQIQNAANPTLGQNGQGVCGVRLHFDHEYIGDLQITLTSPGGQSVTLIGPVGLWGPTDFSTWDILFLPCADPVNPDPGFSDQWNNNQPWGLFGTYTGTYYPAAGCLENFNSGPVNGQWTLTVSDLQANDVGNFYDYEIIFCDPTGINCFSCDANAGNLPQPDVIACEGAPALNLNLPPTYTPPNDPPPATDYTYSYVVGGPGGVIQAYEAVPDLTGYPAGTYTVCGFSYLTAQEGDIPPPDGSLTIAQLSTQLNSNQPPFCGRITSNCVNVTIKPNPDDVEEFQTICAPQCYVFYNQSYCQSGTYVRNLTLNGCPYKATLYLTVIPVATKSVTETICQGGCSQTPGFENVCLGGTYQETFVSDAGCDSVVTLNVTVMAINANIVQPVPQITCNQPTVSLQGTGSTTGPGTSFLWTASNGGNIVGSATGLNATVNAPGDYQLRVCRTLNNVTCCDSTSVTVTGDQAFPAAPAAVNGPNQVCPGQSATYTIAAVTGATTYNWTVPAGATINSGQNTTSLSVTWNSGAGGNLCVTAGNACGTSTATCLPVTIAQAPVPGALQGLSTVCAGTSENYSITTVPGATNYNWTVSAPASIASGQGTPAISVNWGNAPSGSVCVNLTSVCGISPDTCLPVQINAAPAASPISGDTSLCLGTAANYIVTAVPGATGYNWTIPANGTITSGQNTPAIGVNWSGAPGGDVCLVVANACGNGPQNCIPVVVDAVPVANAGSNQSLCALSADLQAVLSINGSTGTWTMVAGPGSASFVNAGNPATGVTVTQPGSYLFQWTESNGDCVDSDSVSVAFNELPVAGLIATDCDATNQNYTVSFPVSGGTAPYTVAGGTVAGGVFTSNPIVSGQSYTFQVVDANGCTSPEVTGSINCNCSTNAGQMSLQTLTACEGQSVSAEHIGGESLDANDVSVFVLHDNPGAALGTEFARNTSGVFSFQNGMSYGTTYYVSFVAGNNQNGNPDPTDPCLSVSQGQPVIFYSNPTAFAGVDSDTCGLTLQLQGGGGSGTWTITSAPPGGVLDFSDIQDSTATVTSNVAGVYALNWAVETNGCTDADDVQLQFNLSPVLDDLQRICDATNQNYTVVLTISGGTTPYNVNGSPVTGTIFTSAPIPNSQTYNFTIADANACLAPVVTGSYSCDCATDAGVLQGDTLKVCGTGTLSVSPPVTAPVLDGNDVVAYLLHDGPGPVAGQIFSQNTSGAFSIQAGMNYGQVYYISAVAGDDLGGFPDPADPCYSLTPGQPVIFLEIPQPDAGPDAAVCGTTTAFQGTGGIFDGAWSQISGPSAAVLANSASAVSAVDVSSPGVYAFVWTAGNDICVASDTVVLTFNDIPSVGLITETCNGANTQFSISFPVSGGTTPYTVQGLSGAFAGANFTSGTLPNNSTYTFSVLDANGCESPEYTGIKNCNCTTDAGSMQTVPAAFCAGDPATAVWNNDATLDADDVLQFVLHDQAGVVLGNILATAPQPTFPFAINLQTGVTYYISAVVGNNQNGSFDPADPCLSVTPGAPVSWKPLPDAVMTGDASICAGDATNLVFSGTGIYPLTLVYTDASGGQNTMTIDNAQPVSVPVSPLNTTVYTLVSVSDGTPPVCTATQNQVVTVNVGQPLSAGVANEPVELCTGTTLSLQLINFLTGADPGGTWTETSLQASAPGAFNSQTGTFLTNNQAAGVYTFKYTQTPAAPCSADDETVTVKLLALPLADAGDDQAINCDQAAVLLGGPGTSSGPGIFHYWILNGDTIGLTEQVFANGAGNYTLIATNAAGCSTSDQVEVILDNNPPQAEKITVRDIRCYGEKNGSISVDSFTAAHPPLLYSINGGAFSPNPVFSGLEAGTYTLTLMDANGCESTTLPLQVNEPFELKVELGPDVEAALGDSVYLQALTTADAAGLDTIVWKPLLDSTAAGTDQQRFLPLQSWIVHVAVKDTNGCEARDQLLVRVDKTRHVYIPNVLQVGSDQNSVFQVFGGNDVAEVLELKIYDRWGEQLFEALNFQPNDPTKGWTGLQRGKTVSPGVYVYYAVVLFKDGQQEIFTGDLTVFY